MWPNILKLFFIPHVFPTGCVDPCYGKEGCQSFVDSCAQNSILNQVLGSFTLPINYVVQFDVEISNCAASQDKILNVIQISETGKRELF